jgi:hypothetical protein
MVKKLRVPKLSEEKKDLKGTLIERIQSGKVLPIISNDVCNDLIFGSNEDVIETWAERIDYPLPDRHNLTRMTQYCSVLSKDDRQLGADDRYIKETYIKFLKNALWSIADPDLLKDLKEDTNLDKLSLTEYAERLRRPPFEVDQTEDNSLLLLADFRLPIYLTTSYHSLLEIALKKAGTVPRTEICAWNEQLRAIRSVFEDKKYDPIPHEPLVFHLYGLDTNPDSFVLTEDDHLDFLVAISRDRGTIPNRVRQALAESSLLLLGYRLRDWDFRVLFRGLIKPSANQPRPKSVAIQLEDNDTEKCFLERYLAQEANFEVFWQDTNTFIKDLWQGWKQ